MPLMSTNESFNRIDSPAEDHTIRNFLPYFIHEFNFELLPQVRSSLSELLENNKYFSARAMRIEEKRYFMKLFEPVEERSETFLTRGYKFDRVGSILSSFNEHAIHLYRSFVPKRQWPRSDCALRFFNETWNFLKARGINLIGLEQAHTRDIKDGAHRCGNKIERRILSRMGTLNKYDWTSIRSIICSFHILSDMEIFNSEMRFLWKIV